MQNFNVEFAGCGWAATASLSAINAGARRQTRPGVPSNSTQSNDE
jgi:hypothetical protein